MTTANQIFVKGCKGRTWLVLGKEQIVACENLTDIDIVKDDNVIINKIGKGFTVKGDARGAARWILRTFANVETDNIATLSKGVWHKFFLEKLKRR